MRWLRRRWEVVYTKTAEWDMAQGWYKVDPVTIRGGRFFFRRRAEWFAREVTRLLYRTHKLYEWRVEKTS